MTLRPHEKNLSRSNAIKTVLFDLDGTLADTAPDLAYALNCVLEEQGCKPLPYETIRPVVSHGGIALIKLGFGIDELSMNALSILKVKKIIRSFSYHDAQDLVNQILAFETAKEVEKFLINVLSSRYPKLFPELQENPVHH